MTDEMDFKYLKRWQGLCFVAGSWEGMLKANHDIDWGEILIDCELCKHKSHIPVGDRCQQTPHFCRGLR